MAQLLKSMRAPRVPDFSEADLSQYSYQILEEASFYDPLMLAPKPQLAPFWEMMQRNRLARGITAPKGNLSMMEKDMISDFQARRVDKCDTMVHALDMLLGRKDTQISAKGVLFSGEKEPKKQIQPITQDNEIGRTGGQMMAGLVVAMASRQLTGVQHTSLKVLNNYQIPDISAGEISRFQKQILPDLSLHFQGKKMKGPGREYISEIFSYLRSIPLEEYFMLHTLAVETLFKSCFVWKEMAGVNTPTAVLKEYETCFRNLTVEYEGVKSFLELARKKTLWVWVLPLPTLSRVVVLPKTSFASLTQYLSDSRGFRGTDEAGLSAWSGGFLAIPGSMKKHKAVCRKLSVILGAAMTHTSVAVYDSHKEHVQYMVEVLKFRKISNVKFQADRASVAVETLNPSFYAVSPTAQVVVHCVDSVLMSAKKEDWNKVDIEQNRIKSHFFSPESKKTIIMHHVNSSVWFGKTLFVSAVTSIHNMYPVIANFKNSVASCDTIEGDLRLEEPKYLDEDAYKAMVQLHNRARNLFFLYPAYTFNARMNHLIRKKEETLSFVPLTDDAYSGLDLDDVPKKKEVKESRETGSIAAVFELKDPPSVIVSEEKVEKGKKQEKKKKKKVIVESSSSSDDDQVDENSSKGVFASTEVPAPPTKYLALPDLGM
jgi:hypothetical protein